MSTIAVKTAPISLAKEQLLSAAQVGEVKLGAELLNAI